MFQNNVNDRFALLSVLLLLVSCASTQNQSQISNNKTWNQESLATSAGVVIKACQNMSGSNLSVLLDRYGVQVKRRVSPTIIFVEWRDNRTAQNVVEELKNSGKFCGVQKNLQYQMMKK